MENFTYFLHSHRLLIYFSENYFQFIHFNLKSSFYCNVVPHSVTVHRREPLFNCISNWLWMQNCFNASLKTSNIQESLMG